MLTFFLLFFGVGLNGACTYLAIRNSRVCEFRQKILFTILDFADAKWRINVYESVDYRTMLLSFKRLHVESFYHDDTFLKPMPMPEGAVISPFQIKRL